VTVEYCLDTTTQLQDKMRQKVETNLVEKIQFLGEVELLQSVTTNCVSLLVQELEAGCDLAMVNMIRVNWAGIEQVGDQSQYVSALVSAIRTMVPRLRDCLQTSRKYFTQFCIKFVSSFIPKFLANIYKCKPLGTVGAEQLLLDTHSIKTVLLDLPSIVDSGQVKLPPGARKPPQSYTKLVIKGMTRTEMVLKVVMSPLDPTEAFVEQYLRLVQDPDGSELSKLLDMKGIKRSEQSQIIELFKEHQRRAVGAEDKSGGSPLHSALRTKVGLEPVRK